MCHCSLKPENVLLDSVAQCAKLADFGLLSVYGSDDSETKTAGKRTAASAHPWVVADLGQ